MCCDEYDLSDGGPTEVHSECPDCGTPTVDGAAQYGCYYSPVACDTCGWQPCDGSC
jgi:hypothetical protein